MFLFQISSLQIEPIWLFSGGGEKHRRTIESPIHSRNTQEYELQFNAIATLARPIDKYIEIGYRVYKCHTTYMRLYLFCKTQAPWCNFLVIAPNIFNISVNEKHIEMRLYTYNIARFITADRINCAASILIRLAYARAFAAIPQLAYILVV